jgi:hypothetical protein
MPEADATKDRSPREQTVALLQLRTWLSLEKQEFARRVYSAGSEK